MKDLRSMKYNKEILNDGFATFDEFTKYDSGEFKFLKNDEESKYDMVNEFMEFVMNDRNYTIFEKTKEEMFGVMKEPNKEDGKEYLGLHMPAKNEIWLLKDLKEQQKRKTLMHELMHSYIWCYMTYMEQLNEEDVCNISSNAHDIIEKITNDYFKNK